MRSILLLSVLGALAVPAAADDISIGFGYGNGGRWSVGFGYSNGHNHNRRVVHQKWVPGHYESVQRQVWVPGTCEQVWQPAQYGWSRDACGHRVRVLVRQAGYVHVERPGYYRTVCEQVWVAGHYVRC